MKRKKIRPLGHILLDMEPLLEEMTDEQDMQWSDIIALVNFWLMVHRPNSQEVYLDGTSPILQYTHKENIGPEYNAVKKMRNFTEKLRVQTKENAKKKANGI